MLGTFDKDELAELRDAATYISGLPPSNLWENFRQNIAPNAAEHIGLTWVWLGKSLDAFFGDTSDPLPDSNLPDGVQKQILKKINLYLVLSVLLFQAEKFLKKEAKALDINYHFNKRSDLLKIWALESCCYEINLSLQNHWESHSKRQHTERTRETRKYFSGEISETGLRLQRKRWEKEDIKLPRDELLALAKTPFIKFCLWVFDRYRNELPAFEAYLKATDTLHDELIKKYLIINGQVREYPGRGKNKKRKPKSVS